MRVGLIGPGAIGAQHARAFVAAGTPLCAVTGRNLETAKAFAADHGIAASFDSVEAMLGTAELDAIVVASPNVLHVSQTVSALRAGVDVLCEIPVSVDLAGAEEIATAAMETGHFVMAAHTLRYCPPHVEVAARIARGELRPRHVMIRRLMLRQDNVDWSGRARTWTDDVLWHHGAHAVDLAVWLLGSESVSVGGAVGADWAPTGKPMDVAAVLATDEALATIALSYHSRQDANDVVIIAEDKTLVISDGQLRDGDQVLIDCGGIADMETAGAAAQTTAFLDALSGTRAPMPSIGDVLPAMRVLDALSRRNS